MKMLPIFLQAAQQIRNVDNLILREALAQTLYELAVTGDRGLECVKNWDGDVTDALYCVARG